MKNIIGKLLNFFTTTTEEYLVWEWESEMERQTFIKYFKFCN